MTGKQIKYELGNLIQLVEEKSNPLSPSSIEEYFSQLRICIKYMKFDNEALKRECDLLKKLLE